MFGFGKSAVVPNGYDATMPDNASYGSKVINGNNVSVLTMRALFPSQAAAPYMYGNGSKPATLAGFSPGLSYSGSSGVLSGASGIGGGPSTAESGENPWNLQLSPTGWAIVFLVVGFVGLRHIHWRAE